MTRKTITRATLSEAVYQEVGLSRNESADLLESVLNEITSALAEGDTVKLSSFGSFSIRQKGRRIGRNPKTGRGGPHLTAPCACVPSLASIEDTDQRRAARERVPVIIPSTSSEQASNRATFKSQRLSYDC